MIQLHAIILPIIGLFSFLSGVAIGGLGTLFLMVRARLAEHTAAIERARTEREEIRRRVSAIDEIVADGEKQWSLDHAAADKGVAK